MMAVYQKIMIRLGAFVSGLFFVLGFGLSGADARSGGDSHQDASAAHAEASGGLPQFDVSTFPSQLFWLTISFVILYLFFKSKTLPDISGVIENRREHIGDDFRSADEIKREAEAVQRAYERSLEKAREEATRAMLDMQDEMKVKADKDADNFRIKSEKEVQAIEARLIKAKLESFDEISTIAAEVALFAAEKIVGISTDLEQAKSVVESIEGGNKKKAKAA